jgi:integrase
LKQYRPQATGLFVLESELKPKPEAKFGYYRAAHTFDRLTTWLRGKGVLAHKPIHTMRKEFGSIINESADIYTASRQLRHSNIATTAAYYADNRKRVAVPVGTMLGNRRKKRAKAENQQSTEASH